MQKTPQTMQTKRFKTHETAQAIKGTGIRKATQAQNGLIRRSTGRHPVLTAVLLSAGAGLALLSSPAQSGTRMRRWAWAGMTHSDSSTNVEVYFNKT